MNTTYHCERATTASDIRRAQAVRCEVFGEECGYLDPLIRQAGYEQDPWDLHPDAVHLLLVANGTCVGAARLVLGRLRGDCRALGYGVPMEAQFDLMRLTSAVVCVAEVGRVCVRSAHRGKGAARALYGALAQESLLRGATCMVGCANCEVEAPSDASRLEGLISRLGLWSEVAFLPRSAASLAPEAPASPATSEMSALPPVLRSYVTWGRVTFAGPPVFDRRFGRMAIPFVCDPRVVQQLVHEHP